MDRTVKIDLIGAWVDRNGPNGLLKLAEKSGVSASTISKARLGMVPKKYVTRARLCEALEVEEDALFPPLKRRKDKAS